MRPVVSTAQSMIALTEHVQGMDENLSSRKVINTVGHHCHISTILQFTMILCPDFVTFLCAL